ncbi:NAD-dependent epimerase/dehydratase family protein [Streptomyces murinus]|uniref:NAD-dependent epimerase/dehydratase family protein n=1 Tax=Streptomyces murinus TaxID=33900 RepID=UPI000A1EBB6A|nr:NAD-dependent epimerase/dehydratase family protein [Streptomyces murinus]WDO05346.1 NAD-dependent epimerase/dehydratase family protein [Streptomyces murinus]
MEIVGNGFVAGALRSIAPRHPGVVALAAGVSRIRAEYAHRDLARETALVTEQARRCASRGTRLLYFSTASAALYGTPGCSGTEDCRHPPRTWYGEHKLAMEQLVRRSGCRWLILRLTHLVGPGQRPHQLVPALVAQALGGRVRILRGASRDLLDVDDFVAMTDLLLGAGIEGETVNVASGRSIEVDAIVDHVAALTGTDPVRTYVEEASRHTVSIERLRSLSPRTWAFGEDYYKGVLDRSVGALLRARATR